MRIRKESDDLQEEDILLIADVSDALAHPARVKIFRFILQKNALRDPVCNKDVVAEFDYSQATISQHIKKLVKCKLVQVQKQDRFSYYYTNLGLLGRYFNAISKLDGE
jgi:ArsR family transcriptional regulator